MPVFARMDRRSAGTRPRTSNTFPALLLLLLWIMMMMRSLVATLANVALMMAVTIANAPTMAVHYRLYQTVLQMARYSQLFGLLFLISITKRKEEERCMTPPAW
jgi:hypothetical protein